MNMDDLRIRLKVLQMYHFNIINCYIMGTLKIDDVRDFECLLNSFKKSIFNFEISEENVLEVAKMKSCVQHYTTEILEDEDLLKVAYSNS